jgi:hypothetical protein
MSLSKAMAGVISSGNREQGTGNRKQETGNGEQGTGNREQPNIALRTLVQEGRNN